MAYDNIEIEIRHPLYNPGEVRAFLYANAELKREGVIQTDTYYCPAHRNFLDSSHPNEWLRVRESSNGSSITYKCYPMDPDAQFCTEFETRLSDIGSMKNILESLDFKKIIVVEKTRDVWVAESAEVSIDDVRGLGHYLELEATKQFPDPVEGTAYLYGVLNHLGAMVGEADTYGYPYRLLQKQGLIHQMHRYSK